MEVVSKSAWTGLSDLQAALRCFLLRHCPDPNELEDVLQETLLRAARYRANLSEDGRLKSWAMRIAMNVLADGRRKGWRYVSGADEDGVEPEVADDAVEESVPVRIGRFDVHATDAVQLMTRVMGTMRDDDRRLLASFYGGAGSSRMTARECEIPPHLVKARLFRARKRLRTAMRHQLALENGRPRVEHDDVNAFEPRTRAAARVHGRLPEVVS